MLRSSRSFLIWLVLAWVMLTGGVLAGVLLAGGPPSNAQTASAPAPAAKRVALVIGNADYPGAPLATAANDAGLVAQTLAQAGFDVTAVGNADGETLRKGVHDVLAEAHAGSPDSVIFVYLAGYGVQMDGDNFFVPVDARIDRAGDVQRQAFRLSDLSRAVEAIPAKARVLVYDLARANPFAKNGEMPLAGGLSLVETAKGSLQAFNAAPGTVGIVDTVPYGFYARALSEMLQMPGLPLGVMFDRIRLRVGELTNGAVIPWDDAKVDGEFTLLPAAAGGSPAESVEQMPIAGLSADIAYSAVVARDTFDGYQDFVRAFPRDPLEARVRAIIAARREALTWSAALRANDPRAYWTYMRRYPHGPHRFDARRRLALLHAALEPPPRFDIYDFVDPPAPSAAEVAFVERPDVVFEDPGWASIPPPPGAFLPPPRSAFYDDLPPPPLVPAGVLPVAVPLPVSESGRDIGSGRVTQPYVPGRGRVITETRFQPGGGSTLALAADPKLDGTKSLISRTTTTVGPGGKRTSVQSGPSGAILSRTTTLRDNAGLTIVQTGPTGGVLMKIVTRADPGGGRSTLVTDGRDRVTATVRRNNQGIVTAMTGASGAARLQHPVLAPAVRSDPDFWQQQNARPTASGPRRAAIPPVALPPAKAPVPGSPGAPPKPEPARQAGPDRGTKSRQEPAPKTQTEKSQAPPAPLKEPAAKPVPVEEPRPKTPPPLAKPHLPAVPRKEPAPKVAPVEEPRPKTPRVPVVPRKEPAAKSVPREEPRPKAAPQARPAQALPRETPPKPPPRPKSPPPKPPPLPKPPPPRPKAPSHAPAPKATSRAHAEAPHGAQRRGSSAPRRKGDHSR